MVEIVDVNVPSSIRRLAAVKPEEPISSVHLIAYRFCDPRRWLVLHLDCSHWGMLVKDIHEKEVEHFQLVIRVLKNIHNTPGSSSQVILKTGF